MMRALLAILLVPFFALRSAAVVTNLTAADDWQAAIQSFSGANTAIVAAGTYAVTNALLIPANTLITGTWDRAAVFTGSGTSRVMQAQGGGVRLVGLTVRGGYVPSGQAAGAGIKGYGDGANRVSVSNCFVVSNWYGGGVSYNWGAGAFYVNAQYSDFAFNVATNAWGGGVGFADVSNCTFSNNIALSGGAGARVVAFSCRVVGNRALGSSGADGGGFLGYSSVGGYAEQCSFLSNAAPGGNGGGTASMYGRSNYYGWNSALSGGGVYGGIHSNTVIEFNVAGPGLVVGRNGGGVRSATIYDSIVRSNVATYNNGGIDVGVAHRTLVQGNVSGNVGGIGGPSSVYSCIIDGNIASNAGAVVYLTEMFNCTVVNHVDGRYAVVAGANAQSKIWNNIFWNPGAATNWYAVATNAGNNFSNNPAFLDANASWRLAPGSPCIDAGDNTYAGGTLDFYGRSRTLNGIVDIGAAEFDPEIDSPPSARRRFFWSLLF